MGQVHALCLPDFRWEEAGGRALPCGKILRAGVEAGGGRLSRSAKMFVEKKLSHAGHRALTVQFGRCQSVKCRCKQHAGRIFRPHGGGNIKLPGCGEVDVRVQLLKRCWLRSRHALPPPSHPPNNTMPDLAFLKRAHPKTR